MDGTSSDTSSCSSPEGSTTPSHTFSVCPSMAWASSDAAQAATSAAKARDMNPFGTVRFATLRCHATPGKASRSYRPTRQLQRPAQKPVGLRSQHQGAAKAKERGGQQNPRPRPRRPEPTKARLRSRYRPQPFHQPASRSRSAAAATAITSPWEGAPTNTLSPHSVPRCTGACRASGLETTAKESSKGVSWTSHAGGQQQSPQGYEPSTPGPYTKGGGKGKGPASHARCEQPVLHGAPRRPHNRAAGGFRCQCKIAGMASAAPPGEEGLQVQGRPGSRTKERRQEKTSQER